MTKNAKRSIGYTKADLNWMDRLRDANKKVETQFTINDDIVLGFNTYKGDSKNRFITMKERYGSDFTLIVGSQRSGKTNMEKVIYSQKAYYFKRRLVIYDSQGFDHHLSKYPNKMRTKFPSPLKPFGLNRMINYTPVFAEEEKQRGDILYGLQPKSIDITGWIALDIEKGALIIDELIEKNPELRFDAQALYKEICSIPTSSKEASEEGKPEWEHRETINKIKIRLKLLMKDSFFVNDEKFFLDRKKLMGQLNDGFTLNFNFFGQNIYMKPYVGIINNMIYKELEKEEKEKAQIPPITKVVGEADLLCTAQRGTPDTSTQSFIKDVRRGGKLGIDVIMDTQYLSSIHPEISGLYKQLIVGGALNVQDQKKLSMLVKSPEARSVIGQLEFDANKGIREFIIIRDDHKSFDTFRPLLSPVQTHEERRFKPT